MQGTKAEILRILKRHGTASADEIAARLGFAGVTIRHHLLALERDLLVESRELRRGAGRPCRLYQLSAEGDATFRHGYDMVARGILQEIACLQPDEIAELLPDEKVRLVVGKHAERLAKSLVPELASLEFEERVRRAIEILGEISGFVEVERCDAGIEIRDLNCAYRRLSDGEPSACTWHARFVSTILGCEVCWQGADGIDCCALLIPLPTAGAVLTDDTAVLSEGRTTP